MFEMFEMLIFAVKHNSYIENREQLTLGWSVGEPGWLAKGVGKNFGALPPTNQLSPNLANLSQPLSQPAEKGRIPGQPQSEAPSAISQ